ncbi:hypothetical protein GZH53_06920 [Flavihumibacter sp. R14]|nr:hypothetical protein [Flavihumibacter soli]
MAEIHVQRKRRSLWWLWLLIILIVAAVVYYLYTNNYFGREDLTVINFLPDNLFDTKYLS